MGAARLGIGRKPSRVDRSKALARLKAGLTKKERVGLMKERVLI
jgi:hypothetical protein